MVYIYIFICTTRPKVPPLGSLLKVAQDPYWCKPEWEQTGEGIINLVYFFLIQIFILHSLNPTAPHTSDLISSAQLEEDNYRSTISDECSLYNRIYIWKNRNLRCS